MAAITIRNLEDDLKQRLRLRAAANGHSMEEEVRRILLDALPIEGETSLTGADLFDRMRARFVALGDFEVPEMSRGAIRLPPNLK